MLMLNYLVLILKIYSRIPGDRTMLMLNRSKINILFLHYILYILIFQSLIEILPADFSFMPILFNAWYYRLFTFSAGKNSSSFIPSEQSNRVFLMDSTNYRNNCNMLYRLSLYYILPNTDNLNNFHRKLPLEYKFLF